VVEKQDLDLKLDPEILKAFQSSYSVSCMHLSQRITNHYCRDEWFWSSLDEIWVKETSWAKRNGRKSLAGDVRRAEDVGKGCSYH